MFVVLSTFVSFHSTPAFAAVDISSELKKAAAESYSEPRGGAIDIVGRVIGGLFGFLGIGAAALMIYGGYVWFGAQGNEEQVKKAKDIIRDAFIGLIILTSAYALTRFVIDQVQKRIINQQTK